MIRLEHLPLDYIYVTSPFGPRVRRNMTWHNGTDYRAKEGTPVYAVSNGIVQVSKDNPTGYGLYIVIEHKAFCSLSAHLSQLLVKVGDKVKAGDIIGYSGNTGDSDAAHLHFEIRLGAYGIFWTKCPSDGTIYMFCVNSLPFIETVINRQNMTSTRTIELIKERSTIEDNSIEYLKDDYKFGESLMIKLGQCMI